MHLLEEFLRIIRVQAVGDVDDIEYFDDKTDFVVVDGEESDYGVIRYYTPDKMILIATRTVHGGDNEEIEFTQHGFDILTPLAKEVFDKNIKFFYESSN